MIFLLIPFFWTAYAMAAPPEAETRITTQVQAQLNALIQYKRNQQALAFIPTWVDESHQVCVGVGIEEALICEIGILQTHCKSQKAMPFETCLTLADHYSSLYLNRKAFSSWKSRDLPVPPDKQSSGGFHLESLRNRFVSLRKVLEMMAPPCSHPWSSDCEVKRITHFCTEYSAETSFPWSACVGGILESWRES